MPSRLIGLVCVAVWSGLSHAGPETPAQLATRAAHGGSADLSSRGEASLYAVGYAHLDTQWRWDFPTTIDRFLLDTLDDNFELFERHPEYVFNFTGSVRYEMMREYYPRRYERLKQYVEAGRWFVSGSSVDEGDVNVPSAEAVVRQVLYGNLFFEREFGKISTDFMLPDCFGFPWSMPSIWAHCGLLGFSTQKLTWGSAVGIPFDIGVWEGPDGNGVLAALNPGSYNEAIRSGPADQDPVWASRIQRNGERYGVFADFHYYGVGDQGGAPRAPDVANYTAAAASGDGSYRVRLAASDDLFEDISPALRERLPRYSGDMLLTEHSAGTLTSQSAMKRWNRKAELLLDEAERASAAAWWLGGLGYPREQLERSWVRVLANQMHDILPGTSIPRAYRYSWNDEIVSMNLSAAALTAATGAVAAELDTRVRGEPLVVYNPVSAARVDLVEAEVPLEPGRFPRVYGPDGRETPSQLLRRDGDRATILFVAEAEPVSWTVYDVRTSREPFDDGAGPVASGRTLESAAYTVEIGESGDLDRIFDRRAGRELLAEPAGLVFTYERPREFPAWNMDWSDRSRGITGRVGGPATVSFLESGPVRAAVAITRHARNSSFTQIVRLSRVGGRGLGTVVEVDAEIDWQTTEATVKASFPLAVSNPQATYNWGVGTIARGNNEPKKYEVPSHEWFDLTDESGEYGVTILEDSRFGSDKPSDNEVRLTLQFTPGVRNVFRDQHSQDWGVHELRYGIAGHSGDWRDADSHALGRRFNQPLRVFSVPKSRGRLGAAFSLLSVDSDAVQVKAIKLAERSDRLIVRVAEMEGRAASGVTLRFPAEIVSAREVDGQERAIEGDGLTIDREGLTFDLSPYLLRSFEIELASGGRGSGPSSFPVPLGRDAVVATADGAGVASFPMDAEGRSYPVEMLPPTLEHAGVRFDLAAGGEVGEAVICRGQTIALPDGGDTVHLLAAATEDAEAAFVIGGVAHARRVQGWTGFVGSWDLRVFERAFAEVEWIGDGRVLSILPGFVKRDDIAWFATHRHHPEQGNEAYRFSYLFHYSIPRPEGAETLTLPYDERVRLFAVSTAETATRTAMPAAPLYDTLEGREPIAVRHDYDAVGYGSLAAVTPGLPETAGLVSSAAVAMDRAERFEDLAMGPPSSADDADASRGPRQFRFFDGGGELAPHPRAGAVGDALPRLNDGQFAQNDDDTSRCVWFDNDARFAIDLHSVVGVEEVRTYSWHRGDRAPQQFSLWGAAGDEMPDPMFSDPAGSGWEFIAEVDTNDFGHGAKHGSMVRGVREPLGPYRWLLWVAPAKQSGTFFTEIDVDLADGARP